MDFDLGVGLVMIEYTPLQLPSLCYQRRSLLEAVLEQRVFSLIQASRFFCMPLVDITPFPG
jgi:hypothetical protein